MAPVRERQADGSAPSAQEGRPFSDGTRKAILSTLAYADAAGMPLTTIQVHQRLIAPARIAATASPTFGETITILDELAGIGAVSHENGWYSLTEPAAGMFSGRMSQANISTAKWKKMLQRAYWLQWVPFVRGIAASGSLAAGTTTRDSDWDVFVVAKRGRLYTARIFLLLASRFMGVLRTKSDRIAPDKFCFNHYVADDGLAMEHHSLFVAHALSGLVPILERENIFNRFRQENGWVNAYVSDGLPERQLLERNVEHSTTLAFICSGIELLFMWTVGDGLEATLKWWQQRRIANNPATRERGGRVIANDHEIEFHPRSAERATLLRYNELLHSLGISASEADSGLI